MKSWKTKSLIAALMCTCVMGFSDARAQSTVESTIPGCDSSVRDALKNYAEAKVAYEVAVIDEVLRQPNSILNMICFKDALKKTAESSSQIFSGDFFSNIEDYIDNSIDAHLENYDEVNDGLLDGREVDGICDDLQIAIENLDHDLVRPVPSFESALAGDSSAAEKFMESWEASESVVDAYKTANENLNNRYGAAEFSGTETMSEVMDKAWITSASTESYSFDEDYSGLPAGVRSDIQRAMIYDQDIRKGYYKASRVANVHKPSSASALSCFAAAAEIHAKNSAELFSNDYSNQVVDPINDGLEAVKDAFAFDNVVNYDVDIEATASITVSGGIDVTAGNSSGPTVKDLQCPEMQKKWLANRDRGASRTDLSLRDKMRSASNSDSENGLDEAWNNSSDDLDNMIDERNQLIETIPNGIAINGPDIPFNDREDFCKILTALGINGDCVEDEINAQ